MVRAAIADLAVRIGLQFLTADDAVRSVVAALRQGSPFERWLLVFDNANQPEDFSDFFPSGSGHILLTSRNDVWAGFRSGCRGQRVLAAGEHRFSP